jgi:hypothetical protein
MKFRIAAATVAAAGALALGLGVPAAMAGTVPSGTPTPTPLITAPYSTPTPHVYPTPKITPKPVRLPAACQTTGRASDNLSLTFGTTTFNYQVRLHETNVGPWWSGVKVISGTLCDPYEPVQPAIFQVHGVQFGNDAVFSVQYPTTGPDAGNQGIRSFAGNVGLFGHTAGHWSETGTEGGSGPFTLARI